MKKLLGYLFLFFCMCLLLNISARLVLQYWWVLVILAAVLTIAAVSYRIAKANEWK